MENPKILAIIPARGGSKRVSRKNIKDLAGKPLIAYSIENAKQSKYINRIIVSTEDEEIRNVARKFGAEAPFLRPLELAEDDTPDLPVFIHALTWLKENEKYEPDVVVQLRPTSPLRKPADIDMAIELLLAHKEADSVRTVIEPLSSPYKMYTIGEYGVLEPLMKDTGELKNGPDQKLPKVYRHIGTADVIWPRTILGGNMSGDKIIGCPIKEAYSGINTQEDWDYYEYLIKKSQ